MRSVAGGIDGLEAVCDDGSLVADGGLLLAGTVMSRLGLEALIDDTVRLDGRVAGSGSGRKVFVFGGVDAGGRALYRRRAAGAVGLGGGGAALRGGGAVDCWVVFGVVHVRACAPVRQSGRVGASPGVVWGRRARRWGDDCGFGLHGV